MGGIKEHTHTYIYIHRSTHAHTNKYKYIYREGGGEEVWKGRERGGPPPLIITPPPTPHPSLFLPYFASSLFLTVWCVGVCGLISDSRSNSLSYSFRPRKSQCGDGPMEVYMLCLAGSQRTNNHRVRYTQWPSSCLNHCWYAAGSASCFATRSWRGARRAN